MAGIEREIVERLSGVLGPQRPVPLHEPLLAPHSLDYVREAIEANWVSSAGPFGTRFERAIGEYTGAAHAVVVVNGTAALHTALLLADVGPGDEVLLPALTFVATANAVSYCGAIAHFVDVELATLGVDPDALAEHLEATATRRNGRCINRHTGRRIGALVPMHAFGHPARVEQLVHLADDWGLPVVEDAAESLGSRYRDRHTGTFGRLGVLSFNGNKIVTNGGGGAILTDDEELALRARHLTTTAKLPHRWRYDHDQIGFNYRMPDLNAALGLAQMDYLDDYLRRKRHLASRYQAALADVAAAHMIDEPADSYSNYWLNALLLEEPDSAERLVAACHEARILARPAWTPLHRLPMYQHAPRAALARTDDLAGRLVCLPSGPGLEHGDG